LTVSQSCTQFALTFTLYSWPGNCPSNKMPWTAEWGKYCPATPCHLFKIFYTYNYASFFHNICL